MVIFVLVGSTGALGVSSGVVGTSALGAECEQWQSMLLVPGLFDQEETVFDFVIVCVLAECWRISKLTCVVLVPHALFMLVAMPLASCYAPRAGWKNMYNISKLLSNGGCVGVTVDCIRTRFRPFGCTRIENGDTATVADNASTMISKNN